MARKTGSYIYNDAFRAEAVALAIDQRLPQSTAAKCLGVKCEWLRK
jgi:transposase-like protein